MEDNTRTARPWEAELISRQTEGTLVRIAREGRLLRDGPSGPRRVDLTWIDEATLALVDAAVRQKRSISFVYPAPAGDVVVLLAAQVLIQAFLLSRPSPSVGIVTADPTEAARTWFQLNIGSFASREPISDHFPCWRAGPNGEPPFGHRRFAGILIGRRCGRWPVDVTVFDHLAGHVEGEADGPVVHIFADPLDPLLEQLASQGELIWGWSDSILALWHRDIDHLTPKAVPFSVTHDRLGAIADGVDVEMIICHHRDAEQALARLHDDLRTLSRVVGPTPPRHLEIGLRIAWSHTAALTTLPCRPAEYDAFAGLPPRAARATRVFEHEIMAWAKTLEGDLAEYATVVATDLADLRAALESGNPFLRAIEKAAHDRILVVLRNKTAARALSAALCGDPDVFEFGNLRMTWLRALHRVDTVPCALVVGIPPRSAWHRLDSGVSRKLRFLVLGEVEARRAAWGLAMLRAARARWASTELRAKVWRELLNQDPPPPPIDVPYEMPEPSAIAGPEFKGEIDPFSPLGVLFRDDRPLLGDDEIGEQVAEATPQGGLEAMVEAVEIETDHGYLMLPSQREVDVLDDEPVSYTAATLEPGMRIVIGRHSGRVGLLEALEDRLAHRPDLLAGRLLVEEYRFRIYDRFRASSLTIWELHDALRTLGCEKHPVTVRGWVTPGGPMAPRDLPDLRRLNSALELGYCSQRIHELSAALTRIRTFRRVAGKALARAARDATGVEDDSYVDPETGLSVADLREAVIVATVKAVRKIAAPVRVTDTGRLEGERHNDA